MNNALHSTHCLNATNEPFCPYQNLNPSTNPSIFIHQIDLIAQWLLTDQFQEQCDALSDAGFQCIQVDTSLLEGFWWMAACAAAFLFMTAVVSQQYGVTTGLLTPGLPSSPPADRHGAGFGF